MERAYIFRLTRLMFVLVISPQGTLHQTGRDTARGGGMGWDPTQVPRGSALGRGTSLCVLINHIANGLIANGLVSATAGRPTRALEDSRGGSQQVLRTQQEESSQLYLPVGKEGATPRRSYRTLRGLNATPCPCVRVCAI